MAHYRHGSHYHYHRNLPYISAPTRAESPGLDGIGSYVAQRLVSAIREHSDRPLKLILNFGHFQDNQKAPDESTTAIIYNAPGATMTVREAGLQLISDPARELVPPRHPHRFRNPSPVRAIIGGVEEENYDRDYFRIPSPDLPADPGPGIRVRPVCHNQVPDSPTHSRKAVGTTAIQKRLLHSHPHPHARFCRGCHHRHRKVNSDGYCSECVYVLQSAPLPHQRVVETIPVERARHVPVSEVDESKQRRENTRPGRRDPGLITGEPDYTSDEYEFVGARGRRFVEDDCSELEDWERL
ncbi:hypothetical protein B0T21DRAFT_405203 [Apiosordaria backusii]|uniref:Uncharacterized protein n=1 Tax=Apiosordaria backusii TaxID=314023 RepID=A0AA40A451_9PEZI|nr:hypothetical protein B0T21DRAFT_405203 [Apiosordaria backusii]